MTTRVGVIGIGRWGRLLARTFVELVGPSAVAVGDPDDARRDSFLREFPGVEPFADPAKLLADAGIHAAVVATPAPTHFDVARRALAAGKHVLVEKPLTLSSAEALELTNEADRLGRTLMVDHLLLYHPAVQELENQIRSGQLGEMFYLYSQRVNLGVVRDVENALWSLASHDVAVFLQLVGRPPKRVSASGAVYLQRDRRVEDVAFLHLEFEGGVGAHSHVSWLDPHKERKITVVGSRRMIVFDDMQAERKLVLHDRSTQVQPDGQWVFAARESRALHVEDRPPVREMCAHFLQCVEQGTRPRSDGRNGRAVVRILEAAQRSMGDGGRSVELEAL